MSLEELGGNGFSRETRKMSRAYVDLFKLQDPDHSASSMIYLYHIAIKTYVDHYAKQAVKEALLYGRKEEQVKELIPWLTEKEWSGIYDEFIADFPFMFGLDFENNIQKLKDWNTCLWEFNHEGREEAKPWYRKLWDRFR